MICAHENTTGDSILPPEYRAPFVNQRSYHIGAHGLMEISSRMPEALVRMKHQTEVRPPFEDALRYYPYS